MKDTPMDPDDQQPLRNGITLKLVREGVYTWNIHSHARDRTPSGMQEAVELALQTTRNLENQFPHAQPKPETASHRVPSTRDAVKPHEQAKPARPRPTASRRVPKRAGQDCVRVPRRRPVP